MVLRRPALLCLVVLLDFGAGAARAQEASDSSDDFVEGSSLLSTVEALHSPASPTEPLAGCTTWRECSPRAPCAADCCSELKRAYEALCLFAKLEKAITSESGSWKRLRGSVEGKLEGDQTQSGDTTKINTTVELLAGGYPNEFRSMWKARIDRTEDDSEETVTAARLSFDHYLALPRADSSAVETYTFFERFSDSFMSIEERYETGVGAEIELRSAGMDRCSDSPDGCRGLTAAGREALLSWERLAAKELLRRDETAAFKVDADELRRQVQSLCAASTDTRKECERRVEDLVKKATGLVADAEARKVRAAIVQRRSRWEVGFGLGVLHEIEDSSLTATRTDASGGATEEDYDRSDSFFRASARLSLRFRPGDASEVRLLTYYKPRIGRSAEGFGSDHRVDAYASAEVGLKETVFGAKASVKLTYERHVDSDPPTIYDAGALPPAPGERIDLERAEDDHQAYTLGLKLAWE